jgi:hypothetical protein
LQLGQIKSKQKMSSIQQYNPLQLGEYFIVKTVLKDYSLLFVKTNDWKLYSENNLKKELQKKGLDINIFQQYLDFINNWCNLSQDYIEQSELKAVSIEERILMKLEDEI